VALSALSQVVENENLFHYNVKDVILISQRFRLAMKALGSCTQRFFAPHTLRGEENKLSQIEFVLRVYVWLWR
jgi:hypothetical protein